MKSSLGLGLVWSVVALAGCSDSTADKEGSAGTAGGASSVGGSSGAATGGGAQPAGGAPSSSGGNANVGAPVELPAGSREVDSVVNLVDAEAAMELQAFLLDQSPQHAATRHGLNKSLNLFLEHYTEDYDFVFFVTGAEVPNVPVAGLFEAVTSHAEPGGSQPIELAAAGYRTTGRVKGVIGIPYRANYYPPFSHETLHRWGQYLDPSFGFGLMLESDEGPHWGASSVNGQLGGFDPATLRCLTPAGAVPPACTALPSGRFRYVVGAFGSSANGFRSAPYSELELYLMGLLPPGGVPESFQLLTEAALDQTTYDDAAKTLQVEASGIATLPFSDIVARHGERVLLPEADRHFKAAFVIVSAEVAPDSVLSDVARWAAVFGNRVQYANWDSFETDAGGLATMDTQLGARRGASNPPPAPREPLTCQPLQQNCPRAELSCYVLSDAGYCALSQGIKAGEPCDSLLACAPGLDCVSSAAAPDDYRCEPYCDVIDATSPESCATRCLNGHLTFGASGQPVVGVCLP